MFRPRAKLAWFAGLLREAEALVRLFRQHRVDLLHTNNAGAELAPIAARFSGVPKVLGTWHVDTTYDLNKQRAGMRHRLLERVSMLSLHHAIAVSHATKRDWVSRCGLTPAYQKRITTIHNGVGPHPSSMPQEQARALLGLPKGTLLIGSVGRLDEAKGFEFLVRALPRVVRHESQVCLVLAGRGPQEQHLRSLARSLGVPNQVRFLGFVPEPHLVLDSLDIYAQPSLCEAHPFALLEAIAAGLPVVASSVGGIPETVTDGVTGLLTPARDTEALSCALLKLIREPTLRQVMGSRGRDMVLQHFRCGQMVSKTYALYELILNDTGHTHSLSQIAGDGTSNE